MEKLTKFILIAITGGICLSLLFLYNYGYFSDLNLTDTDDGEEEEEEVCAFNITISIDYDGEKTNEEWENVTVCSQGFVSVLDALEEKTEVKTNDYGSMGLLVVSINGVEGNWEYWVNGDYILRAASKHEIDDFDTIEWVYSS